MRLEQEECCGELLRSEELRMQIAQILKNATEAELKMVLQYIKPISK